MKRMRLELADIPDVRLLQPRKFGDERGFLSETYNRKALAELGLTIEAVQENHSFSARPGTLRGLHFQIPPAAQGKLIRVVRGAAFDIAVDLRRGEPTFGRHIAVILSREAWNQLWIPAGFAHGYCTLEPDTEMVYLTDAFYSPQHERGLDWADPALKIDWRLDGVEPIVADRDRNWPQLADLPGWF